VAALAGFEVTGDDLEKAREALGLGDTEGFATWKDLITYRSGGHTDTLEGLAYKLIWR
jgi:hypothetical protein